MCSMWVRGAGGPAIGILWQAGGISARDVWTGGQLETWRFVMSLKVFKLKSGNSYLCKVPFAVPSPLAAWRGSDGLFWGV